MQNPKGKMDEIKTKFMDLLNKQVKIRLLTVPKRSE